jgi:hypothetical protein
MGTTDRKPKYVQYKAQARIKTMSSAKVPGQYPTFGAIFAPPYFLDTTFKQVFTPLPQTDWALEKYYFYRSIGRSSSMSSFTDYLTWFMVLVWVKNNIASFFQPLAPLPSTQDEGHDALDHQLRSSGRYLYSITPFVRWLHHLARR